MKPEWKAFLLDAGAEMDNDRVSHYGNPERERSVAVTGDVICDLSHQGLISAHGEEAAAFLQGQFTCDVGEVNSGHSRPGAWCTAKGRMVCTFRLFNRGDSFYLRLPREQVEAVLKRLSMYVLRAKVTLEDASGAFTPMGLSGPHAESLLGDALGGDIPTEVNTCTRHGGITIIRIPGHHPRFELYGDLESMQKLWQALNVHCAPVGAAQWALMDILAGIPNLYPATAEAFVPQMTNLHLLNGVSFRKGCYPGQEVVARMQYLGKLKRRMYLIHLPVETLPQPGDTLFDPAQPSDQPAGIIVDAQLHPDGGATALAVMQVVSAEAGEPRLGGAEGALVQVAPLPYAFDLAAAS
ncbi:glycine cleavage system protein T [Ectothiorhodospira shaposhnikovii]|uniref:CAF17-like 4Fe-4S cluster assembly/insertion protein YgfZ n=1 Tax=Ectothiorhodospira shaposhnikovii TaxID=1054 RepID=UPI00190590A8|nr:folate-binding protein YgfZ [Ectothiorhodospira shaposhnikovii]MBK1673794.1 glycine cleavage system protein T [Ectothiorhodospira shaposhnikovii]